MYISSSSIVPFLGCACYCVTGDVFCASAPCVHSIHYKLHLDFGKNLISAGTVAPSFPAVSHYSRLHPAGSITLVMYVSLYFLEVEQGLSMRTQWMLGFILLALICGTCL